MLYKDGILFPSVCVGGGGGGGDCIVISRYGSIEVNKTECFSCRGLLHACSQRLIKASTAKAFWFLDFYAM